MIKTLQTSMLNDINIRTIKTLQNLYNRLSIWMKDKSFYHFYFLGSMMSFFLSSFITANAAVNLNDGRSVVVVAHGDDEVLWFEPVLANAKAIIFLGGSYGVTRYNFLNTIYGSNGVYNKNIPKYYAFDIITDQQWTDEAVHDRCYRDNVLYTYENMYDQVRPILQQLKSQGMRRVITHNPWGEYGHPHHKRISDVMRDMGANDLGFDVWYNDVIKLNIDADNEYYKSWFLNKVPYTKTYVFDFNVVDTVRTGMINTTINVINPDDGSSLTTDLWTWDHGANGYPTGERKFWGAVIKKQDLISKYPALNTQVEQLKSTEPYVPGDPNENLAVTPLYDCSFWPDYLDDGFTVIVAAHADDETLWFEPILKRTMAVVYLGGPLGATRNTFTKNIYETNSIYDNPIKIIPGFDVVTDQEWINLALNPCYRDNTVYTYSAMYSALKTKLLELKAQGMKRVLTHNPWGEYGHPHHRRISNIVRDMAVNDPDISFDVWYDDVVKTGSTNDVTKYYKSWFLTGVTYTRPYIFNYNKLNQVRAGMKSTIVTGTNPNTGQPWSDDLWTWDDQNKNGYPTGERKFWSAVINDVDLIATNQTLITQISKIKGEIPYEAGEQYSEYQVLPTYTCP